MFRNSMQCQFFLLFELLSHDFETGRVCVCEFNDSLQDWIRAYKYQSQIYFNSQLLNLIPCSFSDVRYKHRKKEWEISKLRCWWRFLLWTCQINSCSHFFSTFSHRILFIFLRCMYMLCSFRLNSQQQSISKKFRFINYPFFID